MTLYRRPVAGSYSIFVLFILSIIFQFAATNMITGGSEQEISTDVTTIHHLQDLNMGVHHRQSGDSDGTPHRLNSFSTNDSVSYHNLFLKEIAFNIQNCMRRHFGRDQDEYQIGIQSDLKPLSLHHYVGLPLWIGTRVKRHNRDYGLDLNKYQILSKKDLTEELDHDRHPPSLHNSGQRQVRHRLPFGSVSHLERRDNQDQSISNFFVQNNFDEMLNTLKHVFFSNNVARTKKGIRDLAAPRQERNKRQNDDYESVDCVGPDKWLAKVAYVGLAIKLVCDPCQPVFGVSWTKQVTNNAQAAIQFDSPSADDKRVVLGGDSAIYILHAMVEDQGVYRCSGEEGISSTYRLEVKNTGPMHVIRDILLGGDGDIAIYEDKYDEYGQLSMYTAWSEWGSCSECHEGFSYGERARMGYCFAMSRTDQFPLGLPCSSSEILQEERDRFKDRLDEKVIEACHGYCPRVNPIAKNLTIYEKLLQGPDKEEPTIGYEGSYLLLECPGLQVDSAVTWHNGTRVIDREFLSTTGGRVSIDIFDGLRIFSLEFSDAQPYHCYVDGKRRATFRLVVVSKMMDTNELLESLVYIGILILIYFLIFAIIMMAKHNIRRRQRRKKIEV